jgi:hypothetical protein
MFVGTRTRNQPTFFPQQELKQGREDERERERER